MILDFASSCFFLAAALAFATHGWFAWKDSVGFKNPDSKELFHWFMKGCATPAFLWSWINSGWFLGMPPISPDIHRILLHSNWKWIPDPRILPALGIHLAVVILAWSLTLHLWIGAFLLVKSEDRKAIYLTWTVWAALAVLPAALLFLSLGWMGILPIVLSMSAAALHFSIPMVSATTPAPHFSEAIAKMKFGKNAESEAAILAQLDKQPENFEGWMMLAELLATRFGELNEATRTIEDLCDQPATSEFQANLAYRRLADWHLKIGGDAEGAVLVLERLCKKYPGGHTEKMARHRINQVLREKDAPNEARKIKIQSPKRAGPVQTETFQVPSGADRFTQGRIRKLQRRLHDHPGDQKARESLAIVYAEMMGDARLAKEQVEILLKQANLTPETASRLLHQLASWHILYEQDVAKAREALERIEQRKPGAALAQMAKNRIGKLEQELERRRDSLRPRAKFDKDAPIKI